MLADKATDSVVRDAALANHAAISSITDVADDERPLGKRIGDYLGEATLTILSKLKQLPADTDMGTTSDDEPAVRRDVAAPSRWATTDVDGVATGGD